MRHRQSVISKLKSCAKRVMFKKRRPQAIIEAVVGDSLTYLPELALQDIYEQIIRIEEGGARGLLIEVGCALGGSAIVIAAAKSKSRPLNVYDVFGMIPPPSEKDGKDVHDRYETIRSGKSTGIGGHSYYGYEEKLMENVSKSFTKHGLPTGENNVHLVQGLVQDTLHLNDKVVFAHIDCDWYESVMTCLERIEPKLVSGGVIVIDDYSAWSGCKNAVDEYFRDKKLGYRFVEKTRLHVIKA